MLRFRVHVDTRDHPTPRITPFLVATALLAHHLDLRPEALVKHSLVEDQECLRLDLHQRPSLLQQQMRRELLAFEVTVNGVAAETLQMLSQVRQCVVDPAAQQLLTIAQGGKGHVLR